MKTKFTSWPQFHDKFWNDQLYNLELVKKEKKRGTRTLCQELASRVATTTTYPAYNAEFNVNKKNQKKS